MAYLSLTLLWLTQPVFFLFFQIRSHLCFSTPFFFVSLFLLLSIHLHLIDLFIDAPHTPCHKTCLFVTTEPDRQEGGQTYMSHKTQNVNPTVISDPKGNRPLGVYSINLTHTMLWYTTKMLQYTNLKMFRITLHRKKFRSLNPRVNRQRQSLCFFFISCWTSFMREKRLWLIHQMLAASSLA